MKQIRIIAIAICVFLLSFVPTAPVLAAANPTCIADSTSSTTISSAPCAYYGVVVPRSETVNGSQVDVRVQYIVNKPSGSSTALVLLLAGNTGDIGVTGNLTSGTGVATNAHFGDFLIRSAQVFAQAGYLAVSIDSPSTTKNFTIQQYDSYRISEKQAEDIVTVLSKVNTANLPVILVGYDAGTLSAMAQYMLGSTVVLYSPVTSSGNGTHNIYLGDGRTPNLQPRYGQLVAILSNNLDACQYSTPGGARSLYNAFQSQSQGSAAYINITGGMTTGDTCGSFSYHGFFGKEVEAVGIVGALISSELSAAAAADPSNTRPVAKSAVVNASGPGPVTIDLSKFASDSDGDSLTYSLPYSASINGADTTLNRSTVTYYPTLGNPHDGFVYVVDDGRGASNAGVVAVNVFSSTSTTTVSASTTTISSSTSNTISGTSTSSSSTTSSAGGSQSEPITSINSSTLKTSTASSSTGNASGNGAVPEFPFQVVAVCVITTLVVSSYLVIRTRKLKSR